MARTRRFHRSVILLPDVAPNRVVKEIASIAGRQSGQVVIARVIVHDEVAVADNQSDLTLPGFVSHRSAEAPERGEVPGILDIGGCGLTVDDDRLVFERAASLVITPDALCLRVGGRTSENAPDHVQRSVDPVILGDGRPSIALDARHEQTDQDALAAFSENGSSPPRCGTPLRHPPINIDRWEWRPNFRSFAAAVDRAQ